MDYSGPRPVDMAEVHALNAAVLNCARSARSGEALRGQLAPALQPLLAALTDLQLQRLAQAPFLLLSLRERDDRYWATLLADSPDQDLFATTAGCTDERNRIVTATLAFMWQLTRHSPYTARLIFGASMHWCELVAAPPLFELLRRTANCGELLELRAANDPHFWRRLLQAGLSSEAGIRTAAQLCALQTMLTSGTVKEQRSLRSAACNAVTPTLSM